MDTVTFYSFSSVQEMLLTGGDIKSIREFVLQRPYTNNPPMGHPVRRVQSAAPCFVLHTSAGHFNEAPHIMDKAVLTTSLAELGSMNVKVQGRICGLVQESGPLCVDCSCSELAS